MRNTLILLSSLALAAAASAQSLATATGTTTATYTAGAGITLLSAVPQTYTSYPPSGFDLDDADGAAVLGYSTSTAFGRAGNTFTVTSTTLASLDAPDYGAVGRLAYAEANVGQRYVLTFKNEGLTAQTLRFDLTLAQGGSYEAASPIGRADADPDGYPLNPGALAESYQFGGLIDNTDPANRVFASNNSYTSTSPAVPFGSGGSTNSIRAEFTILPGATRVYRVYAQTDSFAAFQPAPVPEPASLAALGVGALGLLRRRRR